MFIEPFLAFLMVHPHLRIRTFLSAKEDENGRTSSPNQRRVLLVPVQHGVGVGEELGDSAVARQNSSLCRNTDQLWIWIVGWLQAQILALRAVKSRWRPYPSRSWRPPIIPVCFSNALYCFHSLAVSLEVWCTASWPTPYPEGQLQHVSWYASLDCLRGNTCILIAGHIT